MSRSLLSRVGVIASVAAAAAGFTPAQAVINAPIPTNAYITLGGLDWAWARPLPGDPSDLSYQGTLGWRLPTAAELATAPLATDFLFAGANVPYNGTDPISGSYFSATNAAYTAAGSAGACAAGYFNSGYTWCDWQDGNGQTFGPWAGTPGANSLADQLYVRAAVPGSVPEPSTWLLLLLGFAAVGCALRKGGKAALGTFA